MIDIFPFCEGALVKIRCNIDVCLYTQRQHNDRIKYRSVVKIGVVSVATDQEGPRIAYLVINEIVYFLERPAVEFGGEGLELGRQPRAILNTEFPSRLKAVLAHQLHSFLLEPLERLLGEGFDLGAGLKSDRGRGVRVAFGEAGGAWAAFRPPGV